MTTMMERLRVKNLTRHRQSDRGYQFTVLLSREEREHLDNLAAKLGWSRSAVLRRGLKMVKSRASKLKGTAPPGNRRDVEEELRADDEDTDGGEE